MSVTGISDYDTRNGKLKVSGYLTLKWMDQLLHWNETEFGDVTKLRVETDAVWLPKLKQTGVVANDEQYFISSVWLNSNGTAAMILAGEFTGYCNVETLYFPVDRQTCFFTMLAISNDATDLRFDDIKITTEESLFIKHAEWNIDGSNAQVVSVVDYDTGLELLGCTFLLNLSRRPMSILIYTCLPLALIAFLNMVIYVVPVASGERISFSVQILLTLIFFTSNISAGIPQNALEMPLLAMAMATLTFVCSVNVIISVILSRVATEIIKPVSGCLKSFTRLFLRLKLGRLYKRRGAVRVTAVRDINSNGEISERNKITELTGVAEDINITWIMVVDMFDYIIFYMHLIVVLSGLVVGGLYISDVL